METRELTNNNDERLLSDLLDVAFDLPRGMPYLVDFPVWRTDSGVGSKRLGIFKDEKLLSTALGRIANLKTPSGSLSVGIIGGVTTDETAREKGFATSLVLKLINWMEENKTAAIFLWGAEHGFYRRLGFELCGVQVRVPVKELSIPKSSIEVNEGWRPELFELIKRREGGLQLEDVDFKWFSSHKNVKWFWTEAQGKLTAYLAVNRGIDLQGYVHEWGGDCSQVKGLLNHVLNENPDAQLIGPSWLLKKAGFNFDVKHFEYLALVKTVDGQKLFEAFNPGVSYPESLKNLKPKELVQALFGPECVAIPLAKYLPLPIWFWGLDAA